MCGIQATRERKKAEVGSVCAFEGVRGRELRKWESLQGRHFARLELLLYCCRQVLGSQGLGTTRK
jgi:hypothetical protein